MGTHRPDGYRSVGGSHNFDARHRSEEAALRAKMSGELRSNVKSLLQDMGIAKEGVGTRGRKLTQSQGMDLPRFRHKLQELYKATMKSTHNVKLVAQIAREELQNQSISDMDNYRRFAAQILSENHESAFKVFVRQVIDVLSPYAAPQSRPSTPTGAHSRPSSPESAEARYGNLVARYQVNSTAIERIEEQLTQPRNANPTQQRELSTRLHRLREEQLSLEYDIQNAEKGVRRAGQNIDAFDSYDRGHVWQDRNYARGTNRDVLGTLRREFLRTRTEGVLSDLGVLKDK
ncbi:MAG: hypothetical protein O3A01_07970, partial [bacterium]|nr:hypothetical protein [bacterium]